METAHHVPAADNKPYHLRSIYLQASCTAGLLFYGLILAATNFRVSSNKTITSGHPSRIATSCTARGWVLNMLAMGAIQIRAAQISSSNPNPTYI